MKYSRFETLVLVVGAGAVVGSFFLSTGASIVVEEIVAQLLLMGVLVAAVHWGRKGGFVAATLASIVYIVMRIPLMIQEQALSADVLSLIVVRVLTYGLIGIVGGELCGRIKYVFARLEDASSIDDWSQVYNQRIIARTLEASCSQYARYDTPFSIVLMELAPRLFAEVRVSRQRAMVRAVASHIRNDIRLVDEIGRLQDGRFIVVLPHTPLDGANVAAKRLLAGVCDTLGARNESVAVKVLATPDDVDKLEQLYQQLASAEDPDAQPASRS